MNQNNAIFDDQTTHGCVLHSGKGQFLINVKLNVICINLYRLNFVKFNPVI